MTALLYLLMRDHIPMGTVYGIVEKLEKYEGYDFTNSYLVDIAKDVQRRLS